MQQPKFVFNTLRERGVHFFTGVPDSLLKEFCAYIMDNTSSREHIIAANEGNAVALAAGHFLATGQVGLVYMQNSGLGNAINPLLSLADREVYGIPMLLMIGWRGEPGVPDEPQHSKQGRVMVAMLDAMEIPHFTLSADTEDVVALIELALNNARSQSTPLALIVKKGAFSAYSLSARVESDFSMTREQAIRTIVDGLTDNHFVVSTTGKTSRELYEYRKSIGEANDRDFLTVGSMGHASSIAQALAQAAPHGRRVVCIDGDGSLLMHLGAVAVIAQGATNNFLHIVINNGAHDSVGGQPTVAQHINLPGIAKACGYKYAETVECRPALTDAIDRYSQLDGPCMLEVQVRSGCRNNLGRPQRSPRENRDAFMSQLKRGNGG